MRPGKAVMPILALASLGAAPAPDSSFPPLAPQGEASDREANSPSPDCIARLIGEVERAGGRIERAQATSSEKWGRVWRADVGWPDAPRGTISRAVCWNDQLRLSHAESLAPLPTSVSGRRGAAAPCDYTPIENPCQRDAVRIVWLCVRPQFEIYADGHAEPSSLSGGLEVGFVNEGAPESDAAWAARCKGRGGVYQDGG